MHVCTMLMRHFTLREVQPESQKSMHVLNAWSFFAKIICPRANLLKKQNVTLRMRIKEA